MKVLVVKRDKIGDLLLTTPMLAHLKASRPQAEVHVLANDYNAWVVKDNRDIDRLWVYPRVRHAGRLRLKAVFENFVLTRDLKRQHFDWAIVANGEHSHRAVALAKRIGARRTVAYGPGATDSLPLAPQVHEMDRLLAMLAPLGIAPPEVPVLPHYALPQEIKNFSEQWTAERGIGKYIVLGLGARRQKKQPATGQVLRWARHFKEGLSLDTVFMWTPGRADDALYPGDDDVAQPVLDARLPFIHPFRGPIAEALGLVWGARTSIFPDSGLMHFAAASPGGVLGLFAESSVSPGPVNWAPRGPRAQWLEADRSVSELSDDEVYAKIERLLL